MFAMHATMPSTAAGTLAASRASVHGARRESSSSSSSSCTIGAHIRRRGRASVPAPSRRSGGLRLAAAVDAAPSDEPPPPPPSDVADQTAPATPAQRAVAAFVSSRAIDPVTVASPSARNRYLPVSPGFSLPLPPDPVRFPRAPLDIKLAVLLLRSTYECVDGMDVMPMDQFQIKFWKARQAEWEPYRAQYAPLTIEQGKLQDPLYFDFISFVQAEVIAREIPKSASVFEERSGAEGTVRVVRRDATLADNKLLPAVLAQRAGDLVYARMRYGFEDAQFAGVLPPYDERASEEGETAEGRIPYVVRGMRSIADALAGKGYALKASVSSDAGEEPGSATRVRVALEGPANLWGAQALAARGVSPPNEYAGFALTAFCRACGVRSSYQAKSSDVATELEFELGE